MCAVGNTDPIIAIKVRSVFEQRCVEMLKWACITLKHQKQINVDWGEENITANLYMLIQSSQMVVDYDIHPECEHPLFDHAILNNTKNAKSANRIDLAFQHNWSGRRFKFYVESKNLIENDMQKTGRKSKTRSATVIDRYIDTGIDHYLNNHYPLGCLLGYILNGTIDGVVNAINSRLINKMRSSEKLSTPVGTFPWMISQSFHKDSTNQTVKLDHYLFDFIHDSR